MWDAHIVMVVVYPFSLISTEYTKRTNERPSSERLVIEAKKRKKTKTHHQQIFMWEYTYIYAYYGILCIVIYNQNEPSMFLRRAVSAS